MIVMNDFQKEYNVIRKETTKAITDCLASGWYILGAQVQDFEKAFASYIGSTYCIGVANGMEALQIALMAKEIGPGDEVITTAHSAVATALAISNAGAKPVFVDTDQYHHLNINGLEKHITPKTRAIIPVHLFGQVVAIKEFQKLAKKHNLVLIEDACQAHGASFNGKMAGSFGDLGCFSFYPTKNLGGYGDGGAITTNSKELYEKCKMLRNYGQINRYEHLICGLNSRLDELQAAILLVKLKHLDNFILKRNIVAGWYRQELQDIAEISLPRVRNGATHAYHLFVIETEKRDALQAHLKVQGIQSLIHYPIPIHKQACYKDFNNLILPQTETAAKTILSLPIHPLLSQKDVKQIGGAIKQFYGYA